MEKPSKDRNDTPGETTRNAVDRASSVTPLDDDRHLDPVEVRNTVFEKQRGERAKSGNPDPEPGPDKAAGTQ